MTDGGAGDQAVPGTSGGAAGEALFAHGPVPVLLFDPETLAVLDANPAAQRHYGYSREEFARLTLRELRLPGEAPAGLGRMPREAGGRVAGGPFRHRRRDGALLEVEVHVQDVRVDGRPLRLAVLHDVTARRRAEQRERFLSEVSSVLAGSLERQETLEGIAQLAIAHLADGCAVHLHDPGRGPDALALLTVASRDPATAALLRGLERRAAVAPGGGPGAPAPAGTEALAGPVAAFRSGRAQLYQRGPAGDGMPAIWRRLGIHSALCVPLAAADGAFGVVSLASLTAGRHFDVADLTMAQELAHHAALALESARLYDAERTARRLAERLAERTARLQALTAALAGALTPEDVTAVVVTEGIAALGARAGSVALLADDGATLEVVQATGYDPAMVAAFRRLPLDAPLPLCDAVRDCRLVWLATAEERDAHYPQLASVRSPEVVPGAMAAVPLVVEGHVLGAMGLNFHGGDTLDADDRAFVVTLAQQCAQALERARLYAAERRARAAIEAARLEAEAANRTKTEFLAVMSHELRTPLNAIAGYVELLEMELRGPLTDAQREDLARIRRNQRHLLGLINDVLNFAKLETGNVRYDIADVPLREAVEAVEPLIAPQLRQRGLRFVADAAADATARADRDKLQQILLNLLSNAVKFTEAGGEVRVSAEADGHVVRLRVRDTGCGIPPERLEHVFDPFVQLDQRLTRTSEGTGLGLAISRDLARAMDGDLAVESEVAVGSTFTVTLPRGGG
jgi:PAS domain S-box-containing protein